MHTTAPPRRLIKEMVEEAMEHGLVCVRKDGRLLIGCNPESDATVDLLHELRQRLPLDKEELRRSLRDSYSLPPLQ